MRKSKYFRSMDGLDLQAEKSFLKDAPKSYKILEAIATTKGALTDKKMSAECEMNLRTYKRWKNHLILVGLLSVRQLNASTYVYSLGEDAIELDASLHKNGDYKKMVEMSIKSLILIDSDTFQKQSPKIGGLELDPEIMKLALELDKKHPLPERLF